VPSNVKEPDCAPAMPPLNNSRQMEYILIIKVITKDLVKDRYDSETTFLI